MVLIAILAVLLVASLVGWGWNRRNKSKANDKASGLDGPVVPREVPTPKAPLSRNLRMDRPETHKDLTTLTAAESAFFDATRGHLYWSQFNTPTLFISELYRMEAEAVRRSFGVPCTPDLTRALRNKAYLAEIVRNANVQKVNDLAGNISIGEKVCFPELVDATTSLVSVTVEDFRSHNAHLITYFRPVGAFTDEEQSKLENASDAITYSDDQLENAFRGIEQPVGDFFQANLVTVGLADQNVRERAADILARIDSNIKNAKLRPLIKVGLSRYFARMLAQNLGSPKK